MSVLPTRHCLQPYTEAVLAPAWLCCMLREGSGPGLLLATLFPHGDAAPSPDLIPSVPKFLHGKYGVFVLADSFFQHALKMEFESLGPNSITFCQILVLKITGVENYHAAQFSRETQFSSLQRNLYFPFFSKYLKCFVSLD